MVVMMEGEGEKLNRHQAGLPQAKKGPELEEKDALGHPCPVSGNGTSCSWVHSPILPHHLGCKAVENESSPVQSLQSSDLERGSWTNKENKWVKSPTVWDHPEGGSKQVWNR